MAPDSTTTSADSTFRPEDLKLIVDGSAQIDAFLHAPGGHDDVVFTAIERSVGERVDQSTWMQVWSSLSALIGEQGMNLLAWIVVGGGLIEQIEPHMTPTASGLIRRVFATWREELKRAYEGYDQLPNNWRSVSREVYHDLLTNRSLIRVTIEKFSGEASVVEGPGDSILGLARYLIATLRLLGSRTEFSDARINEFLTEADPFIEVLRPVEAPGSAEAPGRAAVLPTGAEEAAGRPGAAAELAAGDAPREASGAG